MVSKTYVTIVERKALTFIIIQTKLLVKITKYTIDREYISYDEWYLYNEKQWFNLLKKEDIY